MTVEELKSELEKIISELTSSGFASIDSGTVEKLDKFAISAGELGMKEGNKLIKNLSEAMKAIQGGKSQAKSGDIRLMALDFYAKKLSSATTEDL